MRRDYNDRHRDGRSPARDDDQRNGEAEDDGRPGQEGRRTFHPTSSDGGRTPISLATRRSCGIIDRPQSNDPSQKGVAASRRPSARVNFLAECLTERPCRTVYCPPGLLVTFSALRLGSYYKLTRLVGGDTRKRRMDAF